MTTDETTIGEVREVGWGAHPDHVLIAASVAGQGWPVLALWPGSKRPTHHGSTAPNHADHWLTTPGAVARAAVDHDERERPEGARRGCPSYAAMTGQGSSSLDGLALVALDLDGDADVLAALLAEAGADAVEWADKTMRVDRGGRDRLHLWGTLSAAKVPPSGDLADGLEWRGSTGYVLLPGSRHPSGSRYVVTGGGYELTKGEHPLGSVYVGLTDPEDDHPTGLAAWVLPLPIPDALLAVVRRRLASTGSGSTTSPSEVAAKSGEVPTTDRVREGTAYARVLDALGERGRLFSVRGPEALAHCPGPIHRNNDRHPSLSVSERPGLVLLKCYAHDTAADVVEALGLRMADLYDDPIDDTSGDTIDDDTNGGGAMSLHAAEPPGEDDGEAVIVLPDEPGQMEATTDPLARARERFRLYDRDALDSMPEPAEVVAGVLPALGALVVVTGSRGLGKSLTVLDLSGALSCGLDHWYTPDHRVTAHGSVLYVAGEGFHGIPRRVRAWESHHGRRLDGVTFLPTPIDLKRPTDARDLTLIAADLGAVMVVADSARATGAGKEDTEDMGAYVRGLDALRGSGALVMALHNTGWDDSRGRGSTLLPDAADTVLHLDGKPNPGAVRRLTHHKHRDGDMLDGLRFRFLKVEGTDSGVLVPTDSADERKASAENNRHTVEVARLSLIAARVSEVLMPSRIDPSRALSGRKIEETIRGTGYKCTATDVRAAVAGLVDTGHLSPETPHRLLRPFYVVDSDGSGWSE